MDEWTGQEEIVEAIVLQLGSGKEDTRVIIMRKHYGGIQ